MFSIFGNELFFSFSFSLSLSLSLFLSFYLFFSFLSHFSLFPNMNEREIIAINLCQVFFLCVIFTPICTEELPIPLDPIPPCRQVCRKVRSNCEPLINRLLDSADYHTYTNVIHKFNSCLNRMGYVWPQALDCKNFPDVTKGICLTPESVLKKGKSLRGIHFIGQNQKELSS